MIGCIFLHLLTLELLRSIIQRLKGLPTSIINTSLVLVPLGASIYYYPGPLPFWVGVTSVVVYGLLTTGTLVAWWIPYFFGSSDAHKAGFAEYDSTHHFLSARGDNVIPNTMHVVMHLFIWSCFALSVYLLIPG